MRLLIKIIELYKLNSSAIGKELCFSIGGGLSESGAKATIRDVIFR
jgi:hypothetical protein